MFLVEARGRLLYCMAMWRTLVAVLAGWVLVGILVVLTDSILMKVFPKDYVAGQMPPDHLTAISLITATLYSAAGGWLTARLARSRPWLHAGYLIVWGETMGLVSLALTWGQIQLWYQIGLLVLWPAAVAAGCWARAGRPGWLPPASAPGQGPLA